MQRTQKMIKTTFEKKELVVLFNDLPGTYDGIIASKEANRILMCQVSSRKYEHKTKFLFCYSTKDCMSSMR